MDLMEKIKHGYELCINGPSKYKEKVDSIFSLLELKGKYKLISEHCPVYFFRKTFQISHNVLWIKSGLF